MQQVIITLFSVVELSVLHTLIHTWQSVSRIGSVRHNWIQPIILGLKLLQNLNSNAKIVNTNYFINY